MNSNKPQGTPDLPYTRLLQSLLAEFSTDPETGLSKIEASNRILQYGYNRLPEPRKASPLEMFVKQFANFMIGILLGAVGLSIILKDYKDAILIGIVVLINAVIGFFQEYKAEKTLASLKNMSKPTAKTVRDGKIIEIPSHLLVPGDIIILEEGDNIPADVRLIEAIGLEINEALLTGESTPSPKDATDQIKNKVSIGDQLNMAFMGTLITAGNGKGVVTTTGASTQMGKIAATLAIPYEKPTPLQKNLSTLGRYLIVAALVVSAIIFIVGYFQGREIRELLFTVISLAVAVIPEGLIAVVTVTMAIGVQRMAKRQAIVRSLPAVETLGAVNVICSDKTGTLTEGKMVATDLWVGNKLYTVSGSGVVPEGSVYVDDEPVKEIHDGLKMALTTMSLCNDAVLQKDKNGTWEGVGDPTEIALQVLAHKLDIKREDLDLEWKFIEGLPFDSDRKRMSMLYHHSTHGIHILTKGAPEQIFKVCTEVLENGKATPFTEHAKRRFEKINNDMAGRGLRILALSTRRLPTQPQDIEPNSIEKDMLLLGMVGVLDPARPEAKNAVAVCHRAGIKVIMVTGDQAPTAINIATSLGIYNQEKDRIVIGEEMDKMTEEDLMQLTPFPKIFARVSPENKLMLINALRKMKHIVAMTGDGVNDAAAIKHANVGVAMGQQGTDVTKQAADIILADDNFATIVAAVEEGRRIFTNLLKFIRYLLSCSFSNVFAILLATAAGFPLPFTPIQILWLNLVTDSPPALALGFDGSEEDSMTNPPRNTKKGFFRRADIVFILYHGIVMAMIMLFVFLCEVYLFKGSLEKARTMAFAMLVMVQLTQAFNAKSTGSTLFRKDLFSNKGLLLAVGISFGLLLIGMYFPILNGIFEQVALSVNDWAWLFIGVAIFITAAELFKLFRRRLLN